MKVRIRALCFLALVFGISKLLDFGLIPYNAADMAVDRITTRTYDDLFIGTSHGANNIDPVMIDRETGRQSTNACLPREFPVDSFYLVRLACASGHKPKRVIYELDPSYWVQQEPEDGNSYYIYRAFPAGMTKLRYFKNKIMHLNWRFALAPWWNYRDRFPKFWKAAKAKTRLDPEDYVKLYVNDAQDEVDENGWIRKHITDQTKPYRTTPLISFSADSVQPESSSFFLKLVDLCRSENIELVIIRTPIPRETRRMSAGSLQAAHDYFNTLCTEFDIPLIDMTDPSDEAFEQSDHYVDADGHMDEMLAEYFSKLLGKRLKELTD